MALDNRLADSRLPATSNISTWSAQKEAAAKAGLAAREARAGAQMSRLPNGTVTPEAQKAAGAAERAANVARAKAAGTFDATRQQYNAANAAAGLTMDEAGDILQGKQSVVGTSLVAPAPYVPRTVPQNTGVPAPKILPGEDVSIPNGPQGQILVGGVSRLPPSNTVAGQTSAPGSRIPTWGSEYGVEAPEGQLPPGYLPNGLPPGMEGSPLAALSHAQLVKQFGETPGVAPKGFLMRLPTAPVAASGAANLVGDFSKFPEQGYDAGSLKTFSGDAFSSFQGPTRLPDFGGAGSKADPRQESTRLPDATAYNAAKGLLSRTDFNIGPESRAAAQKVIDAVDQAAAGGKVVNAFEVRLPGSTPDREVEKEQALQVQKSAAALEKDRLQEAATKRQERKVQADVVRDNSKIAVMNAKNASSRLASLLAERKEAAQRTPTAISSRLQEILG